MSEQKKLVCLTEERLAAAFTEWDRRYRENPEQFMSEAAHLLQETPATYGAACAPYFMQILEDIAEQTDRAAAAQICDATANVYAAAATHFAVGVTDVEVALNNRTVLSWPRAELSVRDVPSARFQSKISDARSVSLPTILSEETGDSVVVRSVVNEKIAKNDCLADGEIIDEPAQTLVSDPESDSTIS